MIDLTFTQYLILTYILWMLTSFSYSVYLHRYLTHRAVELSNKLIIFFKIHLWLVLHYYPHNGFATWVDIHTQHHAYSDTIKDPHSPTYKTFNEMFDIPAVPIKIIIEITPLDKFLFNLSAKISGRTVFFIMLVALFNWVGVLLFLTTIAMPVYVPTILINYVGHKFGYNTELPKLSTDKSKNLLPWGILAGGEELHGNHHRHPRSPTFATHWWEIDPTYLLLKVLSLFKLVRFR